jgi:hypothetical protein
VCFQVRRKLALLVNRILPERLSQTCYHASPDSSTYQSNNGVNNYLNGNSFNNYNSNAGTSRQNSNNCVPPSPTTNGGSNNNMASSGQGCVSKVRSSNILTILSSSGGSARFTATTRLTLGMLD